MRLFLSSENLGNYPEVFLLMVGGSHKLAVIHNAIDDWSAKDKKQKIQAHQDQLIKQGFKPTEIDLRLYFNKPRELDQLMRSFDGIFLFGGNTFILRRAMVLSGLDTILKKLVSENKIAYGGSSAGAIIATPSLKGSEHGDDPNSVPPGYIEEVIWDGLNLVPFYIVPHYKSEWWGEEAEQMIHKLQENRLPYYALEDGQVVVVKNKKVELLK